MMLRINDFNKSQMKIQSKIIEFEQNQIAVTENPNKTK